MEGCVHMKIWTTPFAAGQMFAANEYVSACYKLDCYTKNASVYQNVYADTNGNGVYDEGIDLEIDVNDKPSAAGRCDGYFTMDLMEDLVANGFAKNKKTGEIDPVFYTFDEAHNKHVHATPILSLGEFEADPSNKS